MRIKAILISLTIFGMSMSVAQEPEATASYIIQGNSADAVVDAVLAVEGEITHELGIIDAVAATLTMRQHEELLKNPVIRNISANATVKTSGGTAGGSPGPYADFPELIGAAALHDEGIKGGSVTVAILDSGMAAIAELNKDTTGVTRTLKRYNSITDQEGTHLDKFGHGTHVASIILNTDYADDGSMRRNSIAPDVRVTPVKAFDSSGDGTYANVIRGLDWIYAHKDQYNIRVLNLSFSAPARSYYWEDPINQAVMKLWQAGIVVVASAGNSGPEAMSIGVPGNVPYVITVGAMSDNYTPADGSDDFLASFSSTGPTVEGFVKPEVVAPGGHMVARSRAKSVIAKTHPEFHDHDKYFTMSGTSQAAAVVSGIAALVLDANPGLSNDDVKCRILAASRPAVDDDGELAYSIFQQGAGMVDAYAAVHGTATGCANQGLDINLDVTNQRHFGGRANMTEDGHFYIMGLEGYLWTDGGLGANGYLWTDGGVGANGYLWTDGGIGTNGYLWTSGYLWTDGGIGVNGYLWTDGDGVSANGYLWTDGGVGLNGYLWTDGGGVSANGYLWTDGLTEAASVNYWVEQE